MKTYPGLNIKLSDEDCLGLNIKLSDEDYLGLNIHLSDEELSRPEHQAVR